MSTRSPVLTATGLSLCAFLALSSLAGVAFGCTSGGDPVVVKSAPLPEGWPALTPVGEVQVKTYPAYRAAVARRSDAGTAAAPAPEAPASGTGASGTGASGTGASGAGDAASAPATTSSSRSDRQASSSLFMVLFRHIDDAGIPMTAPVRMDYAGKDPEALRMSGMAFLYESMDTGTVGPAGKVVVEDVPERTVISVGVRGDYTTERMEEGMILLERWLEANAAAWERDGDPMYLGYNGPFTPSGMRYGEVQIPVRSRPQATDGSVGVDGPGADGRPTARGAPYSPPPPTAEHRSAPGTA